MQIFGVSYLPTGNGQQPSDRRQCRTLCRAVSSQKTEYLALWNGKGQVLYSNYGLSPAKYTERFGRVLFMYMVNLHCSVHWCLLLDLSGALAQDPAAEPPNVVWGSDTVNSAL